jgi:hypothetical protein
MKGSKMNLALHGIVSLIQIVCFILVVVQMFKHNQTGMGVASLVTLILCGLGMLIAFIYGWVKAGEWHINNLMLTWTGAILAEVVLNILAPISLGGLGLPAQ